MKFLDRVLISRADEQMENFEFSRYQHENKIPCMGGCGRWVCRGKCQKCHDKEYKAIAKREREEFERWKKGRAA